MTSYAVNLYDNPARLSTPATDDLIFLMNLTGKLPDLRCSWKDIGGCWKASGGFQGSDREKIDFWLTRLGTILGVEGGRDEWQGQVVRMDLTANGQTFIRTMEDMANRCKLIYTRIGSNLVTNPFLDSGSWTQIGSPSTYELVTDRVWKGTSSQHIVAAAGGDGSLIEDDATITANRGYVCSVQTEIISGTWTLQVTDSAGTTIIAQRDSGGTGKEVIQCSVSEENTTTTVDVRLVAANASDEIYADAARLYLAPVQASTEWFEDTTSQADWGVIEGVFIGENMTDAEAEGEVQRELTNRKWPKNTLPKTLAGAALEQAEESEVQLKVYARGLSWWLSWEYVLSGTSAAANTLVSDYVGESTMIANSYVESNATTVDIEDDNRSTLWSALQKVAEAGDGSGDNFLLGVYPDRKLVYKSRPTTIAYEFRRGVLSYYNGPRVTRPWELRPGWCKLRDMPPVAGHSAGYGTAQPDVVWLEEVEFVAPDSYSLKVEQ